MKYILLFLFFSTAALAQNCNGIVTTINKQNQTRWLEKTVISNGLAKNSPIRKITINRAISTETESTDTDFHAFLWFEVYTQSPKWNVDGEAVILLADSSEIRLPISLKPKAAGKQFYSSALLTLLPDRVEQIKVNKIVKVELDGILVNLGEVVSANLIKDFNCIMEVK